MKRAVVAVMLGGLVLALTTGGGIAAAAGCPNEAMRIGPSVLLPECRAYEQVTPVDKEGGAGIFTNGVVQAAPSGEAAAFISASAYAGAQGSPLGNRYLSTRGGSDWLTKSVDGAQAIQELILVRATFAFSENLEYTLNASKEAFTPGAIPFGSNLYLRNTRTGALSLISATPGNKAFYEETTLNGAPFVGASSDWSHLLLFSRSALAPGAVEGEANLYEYSGGELKLAAPPGAVPAAQTSTAFRPNVMSADGRRFFFTEGGVLYMREDGTTTVPISASEKSGEEGTLAEGSFYGATADGSTVFFSSFGNLTGQSEDNALYRYEATAPAGHKLTDLTPESINETVGREAFSTLLGASEDGEYVYFTSSASLTPTAPETEEFAINTYVWHGAPGEPGTIRFIAQTEPQNSSEVGSPNQYRASANGEFLALGSRSPLTAEATPSPNCAGNVNEGIPAERCMNVFVYSYAGDNLVCVTCNGAVAGGDSALGGQRSLEEVFTYVPRSVLNDGTVFFDTPQSLVPRDTNSLGDAYEWRAGRFDLLSTGTADTAATFGDSTPDGRNVFIRSSEPLVGQDKDRSLDVYDVRVEGGLAAQAGSTPPVACATEESCRTGIGSTPAATMPSSSKLTVAGAACIGTRNQARTARRKAAALGRRAKHASGRRAVALRRQAKQARKRGDRLARRAHSCEKGAGR